MPNLSKILVDKATENCIDLYNRLPKNGKPTEKQWTVLSCFLKFNKLTTDIEVVSLGTGSKCIGSSKLSPKGDILNDSHAEIFARRSFIIYLYDNIEKCIKFESSIFDKVENKFKLKENLEFIFYSSQLPCGDATIVPKDPDVPLYGNPLERKRQSEVDEDDVVPKRRRVSQDIHRTGAKCLPHSTQDLKAPGKDYHIVGQPRLKPGRGDKTLSMSCSDKIARWIHIGAHGALLDCLCDPIQIKYIVIGGGVPYSEESLYRAVVGRNKDYATEKEIIPEFHQSSVEFSNIKSAQRVQPAPTSIVWVKLRNPILEVAVLGKKIGVTKKELNSQSSSLCISKYNLYRRFLNILIKLEELKESIVGEEDVGNIPYNVMKKKAERYVNKWLMVKENFFKIWTIKPDIWNFCIDVT